MSIDPWGMREFHLRDPSHNSLQFYRGLSMRFLYLILALIGTALPYSQFIPWLLEHGPNIPLLFAELFSTHAGAFFALDVLISAVVLIGFIRREGSVRKMRLLWLPIAATCLVGASSGLPLFLYLRERQQVT